jgi:predicted RNase H-like HicB family nuclease
LTHDRQKSGNLEKTCLDETINNYNDVDMKQRYHTIIKQAPNGWFVGWAEEIPGTITHGRTLCECRENLRESLQLMVETHRDEARLGLDSNCILESMEIDITEPQYDASTMSA